MKLFLAATAATLFFPMAAFAAGQNSHWEARTCTVAQIQNNVGVCSKVELPTPARDVRICVRSSKATKTSGICQQIALQNAKTPVKTTASLGGLTGAGPAILVLVVGAALAGSGGGGNTPGTN